jgi:4-nitrophenyl phosphatase
MQNDFRLDNLILDMDGVLWRGETPMPGLAEFFETLRVLDINFVLATNNATKVATQYTEKLARFGIDVGPEAILTSAEATAAHLEEQYEEGALAYVVGESGLRMAMSEKGFDLLDADGFVGKEARCDVVVVGFTRHVCYEQLASATHLINNGAHFVGTNPDVTFPSEYGPMPGAGAMLAFLQAATAREPEVIGKPGRGIFEEALERLQGKPSNTAMVGDRLETDIVGAHAAGINSILLLSGVTSRSKVENSDVQPDLIFEDIRALTNFLKEQRQPLTVAAAGENRRRGN